MLYEKELIITRYCGLSPKRAIRFRVAPPKQKHPKAGAFVLEMILPQSKRRVSAGSMRVDSVVNKAPVGLQSRIVTEPAGEKRLQKKPQKPQCFGLFSILIYARFRKRTQSEKTGKPIEWPISVQYRNALSIRRHMRKARPRKCRYILIIVLFSGIINLLSRRIGKPVNGS